MTAGERAAALEACGFLPRQAAFLKRLDIDPAQGEGHPLDIAEGNPVKMLFGEGYALQTILLWVIFFCSLMKYSVASFHFPSTM